MLRIVTVDPHPALRAGLDVLLRAEPGLVPVGAAPSCEEGLALVERLRPHIVLLDHQRLGLRGLAACREFKAARSAPAVVLYTAEARDGDLAVQARVAGADGIVDKAAPPGELFETLRVVGRGETALPPLTPAQMEAAAQRVEPDDLALLAMLADRTPPSEVADTLRLDRKGVGRRIERVLARLRGPLRPSAA